MRAVAAELDTAPMTLYNYVAQREELEVLVVEAVLDGVVSPCGPFADWRDAKTSSAQRWTCCSAASRSRGRRRVVHSGMHQRRSLQ